MALGEWCHNDSTEPNSRVGKLLTRWTFVHFHMIGLSDQGTSLTTQTLVTKCNCGLLSQAVSLPQSNTEQAPQISNTHSRVFVSLRITCVFSLEVKLGMDHSSSRSTMPPLCMSWEIPYTCCCGTLLKSQYLRWNIELVHVLCTFACSCGAQRRAKYNWKQWITCHPLNLTPFYKLQAQVCRISGLPYERFK